MDKESDSRKAEENKPHARREDAKSVRHSRSASRHHHHSPRHSATRAHAFSESESSPSLSPVRHHRRRSEVDELQGEFKKIKPPTFDGEHKKDEDADHFRKQTLG
jgi:hypothetical protein